MEKEQIIHLIQKAFPENDISKQVQKFYTIFLNRNFSAIST